MKTIASLIKSKPCKIFLIPVLLTVFFAAACCNPCGAQVSASSLLVNGDFESGISGTGFQTPAPYNFIGTPPALTGNSSPSDYAIITNPQPMNTANFIASTDHSGTGKMMVIDGTTTGGQQRFWKAGNSGGGVGPLTTGLTYTFSYWVKNVSASSVDAATTANIGVAWNNAGSIALVSGSAQVSFPGTGAAWQKVTYSFVPSSAFVNIELYNNITNTTGNDFALDDLEVLPPAIPLSLKYAVINPSCPGGNDGFITVYANGGTPPYTYSLNGSAFSSNNIFSTLGASVNNAVSVKDAATPIVGVVSSPATINIVELVNPLVVRTDTTICSSASVILSVSGSSNPYTWTAVPADATLTAPNAPTPTVSPAATTVYTVTSSTSNTKNLIYNGDFSLGDVGFFSDYTFLATNASGAQSTYGIVTNPNTFEPAFSPSCRDHTTTTGNMFVADGSPIITKKVWCQTIPVATGTTYTFNYFLQTVATPSPAQIETQINGSPITGVALSSTLTAPAAACGWVQATYTWNSGAATTAQICLYDRNNTTSGNDFSLDDISFTRSVTCSVRKTVNVTVSTSATPNTTFSYSSPVCANSANISPTLTTGFTTGGVFSSTPGLSINAATGVINVGASTPNTYSVTYTVGATGCTAAGNTSKSITITATIPSVTDFSYTSPVCANSSNPIPTPASGFTTGGTYSSTTGLSINSLTGVINLAASTPTTYNITYSVNASPSTCVLAGTTIKSIIIKPVVTPVTDFNYTSPVCVNASNPLPVTVAGFTSGGTFSSTPGLSINNATGLVNLSASTPNPYNITYTVAANAAACQIAGSTTKPVSIISSITPVTDFNYATPVCANATNPLPITVAGFTSGGIYSSTTGLSINASTGLINLSASTPSAYSITYTVAANASTCTIARSSTKPITINAATAAITDFSYPLAVCANDVNPLPTLVAGFSTGGTFASTSGLSIDASTGLINLSASTAGAYNVVYSLTANPSICRVAASTAKPITINAVRVPVTDFNYSSPVCISGTNPRPTLVAGITTGGTFSSTAGLSINSSTGEINLSASSPGMYNVTYAVAAIPSTCLISGSTIKPITISAIVPAITGFIYNASVCANAGNQSPTKSSGFSPGGTFTAPSNVSINATTGVINVAASTVGGPYTITYTVAANGCVAAGSGTSTITINSTKVPVTGFTYATPLCSNNINPLPDTIAGFTTGGVFSAAFGLTLNPATGLIDLASSTPGNYPVTYTVAATACAPLRTTTSSIRINRAPNLPSGSGVIRCGPGFVTLAASGVGKLNWYDDAALVNRFFQGDVLDTLLNASATFYVTDSSAVCESDPLTIVATINELPAKPDLGRDTAVCAGQGIILNGGIYDEYLWNDGSTASFLTATATGEYFVTVTNSTNACTSGDSIAINVLANCDDIYFPTAFSPNGDGYNDQFGPGGNLNLVKDFLLTVYDRFGVSVYSTNSPYKKWDGAYYAKDRSAANFVWVATYFFRNVRKKQKGNLLLLR